MYRDKNKITALTIIDGKQHLASFGNDIGQICDIDLNKKAVIRKTKPHDGKVQSLKSVGKFLVSSGVDMHVIIYDY